MSTDELTTRPDTPRRRARAERWIVAVLFLAVVAAAGGLLLHARRWSATRPADPGLVRLPSDGRYRGARPSTAPAMLAASPAAGDPGGVTVPVSIAELPEDLPMPAGSRRRSLVAYRPLGQRLIKAEYLAAGTVEAVAELMAKPLAAAGWRPTPLPAPGDGGQATVFRKASDVLSLHLQAEGDWVSIVAVITRIDPTGP